MNEDFSWENLHKIWCFWMYEDMVNVINNYSVKRIEIESLTPGIHIRGYDWVCNKNVKGLDRYSNEPQNFMLYTSSISKGGMHTVELLSQAKSNEMKAAIWLYAYTFEVLKQGAIRTYTFNSFHKVNSSAREYISNEFPLWHASMRNLVPEIYLSQILRNDIFTFESPSAVIELAVTNAYLVSQMYTMILFSSLPDGELLRK